METLKPFSISEFKHSLSDRIAKHIKAKQERLAELQEKQQLEEQQQQKNNYRRFTTA